MLCQSEPGVSLTGEQLSGTKLAVGKESREGKQISLNSVFFFFFTTVDSVEWNAE